MTSFRRGVHIAAIPREAGSNGEATESSRGERAKTLPFEKMYSRDEFRSGLLRRATQGTLVTALL